MYNFFLSGVNGICRVRLIEFSSYCLLLCNCDIDGSRNAEFQGVLPFFLLILTFLLSLLLFYTGAGLSSSSALVCVSVISVSCLLKIQSAKVLSVSTKLGYVTTQRLLFFLRFLLWMNESNTSYEIEFQLWLDFWFLFLLVVACFKSHDWIREWSSK